MQVTWRGLCRPVFLYSAGVTAASRGRAASGMKERADDLEGLGFD